jgi:hypothetical protein
MRINHKYCKLYFEINTPCILNNVISLKLNVYVYALVQKFKQYLDAYFIMNLPEDGHMNGRNI